jgi:hypothetical protein
MSEEGDNDMDDLNALFNMVNQVSERGEERDVVTVNFRLTVIQRSNGFVCFVGEGSRISPSESRKHGRGASTSRDGSRKTHGLLDG